MENKKIFLDLDGTLAKFNVRNALTRFASEKGFFANLKAYKGIERINELCKQGNFYIISASPNIQADKDKIFWIEKYLYNIPKNNICFCRIGENKAEIIKNKLNITIDKTCILLDDYTHNLTQWQNFGGIGIKRITAVADNSRKIWKGLTIKKLTNLQKVIDNI